MNNELIEIKDASAGYNGDVILKDINLKIFPFDFIGVIGPNGGGKTTLLKVILRLIKLKTGSLSCLQGLKTGYLPQNNFIDTKFPISVEEVILSGLRNQKSLISRNNKNDFEILESVLNKLSIEQIRKKQIGELSGGQRQRAYIGRAIISNPNLLLLDEPATFVDQKLEGELFEILKHLNKNMAIVVVSHDLGIISSNVKTIACVNRGLHYHPTNEIDDEILKSYNCPIDLITHGTLPHRVLKNH